MPALIANDDRNTATFIERCITTEATADQIADTWQVWLDLTHGTALHRQLIREGLDDGEAERLVRMMRREIADTLNAAVTLSQSLRAAKDAARTLVDEVNRARRRAGAVGTSSVPFGARA